MAVKFPPWEKKGHALQKWIQSPHEPGCPYPISTFTLTYKPNHPDCIIDSASVQLDTKLLTALNINNIDSTYRKIAITQRDESPPTWWIGRVGPGIILLDDIFRSKRNDDPYISEFTKAAYQLDFPLSSLSTHQTWKSSSPEFQILLGTGIGNVVGAFVLCAWGQGRKRISRIVTFHINSDPHKLYMRFDLEDM